MINHRVFLALFLLFSSLSIAQSTKPSATLDEFFNVVGFTAARPSPDGSTVVIATERADWEGQFFREELWLYRDDGHGPGKLAQLTQSGHDSDPHWSPDGQWIAFISERKVSPGKDGDGSNPSDQEVSQIYLISPNGGEAFPLTQGDDDVHSFTWAPDSRLIYYSTRTPWTKQQNDAYKKEWKDVIQYRASERGDTIFSLAIADAIAHHDSAPSKERSDADASATTTLAARAVSVSPWRVEQLQASPDGHRLAFASSSISQRQEKVNAFEIYAVDLTGPPSQVSKQVTRNEAVETDLRWAPDSRHVFFRVDLGSVEGKYKDTQTRLYSVDADNNQVQRWASDFSGAIAHYSVTSTGGIIAAGKLGTEIQTYTEAAPDKLFTKVNGLPGWYEIMSGADHSSRLAFVHSSVEKPTEVYFAESVDKLADARPITAFNKLLTERDLPKGKPYRWKSDDGTSVEGMLIYPPGKFEAKNLPMLVLIHGGPADADGNHFEADWYQWDRVAASAGWLVFEPNYRGSSGYGDKVLAEIVPQLVSRPGRDILTGVDALVKDGIADPNLLSIGGYSYGGYMTNWLITQTTRFKAAVTGAGAVEHVANWGNDDTTMDDAYFLGGRPWEAAQRYLDEAAIFQIEKVRTPTHMVAGADDIRVAVLEDYLLEHALFALEIPSQLIVFPGEGHGLGKNPWHGKIKVREELKWLQKYGGVSQH
jgi:dipeptidyl aminopeptidase/acylaminoacyl peptidase